MMQQRASYLRSFWDAARRTLFVESTSHTPPEDRQARLSGAGCGYIRISEIPLHMMHTVQFLWCTVVHHLVERYRASPRIGETPLRQCILYIFTATVLGCPIILAQRKQKSKTFCWFSQKSFCAKAFLRYHKASLFCQKQAKANDVYWQFSSNII